MQGFYTLIGFSFVAGGCLLAKTNSSAILGTVVAIKCQDTSSASGDHKNQLRQNQYGGVFSGPRRFCTRLIEFCKGVV